MKIISSKVMPNGSQAAVHKIENITITGDRVRVNVVSYTSDDVLCWSETLDIADDVLSGDPRQSVGQWLIDHYLNGGVVAVDPSPVEVLRATLLSRVDRFREEMVAGGCVTSVGRVQTDDVSIRNILGSVQTASLSLMLNQEFSIKWRMADNSDIVLDANQMIAMGVSVMQHIKLCYERSWMLKDVISNLEMTIAELSELDITSGWVADAIVS